VKYMLAEGGVRPSVRNLVRNLPEIKWTEFIERCQEAVLNLVPLAAISLSIKKLCCTDTCFWLISVFLGLR
jgi:hypothetical protein